MKMEVLATSSLYESTCCDRRRSTMSEVGPSGQEAGTQNPLVQTPENMEDASRDKVVDSEAQKATFAEESHINDQGTDQYSGCPDHRTNVVVLEPSPSKDAIIE